jgi:hypothetical protein
LLVDEDDPEKRIAELERRLAEQNRGAGLPPASADAAAVSGRFVVYGTKGPLATAWWLPAREFGVCVTKDGLTVDQRPGDVFAFRDAQLGLWAFGCMTLGTALHLQCGALRFVLGGRDYRVATNTRLEAAPVDRVDAWMWASDFYELLTGIASPSGLDVRGAAPGEATRCWLVSTSAIKGFGYSTLADKLAHGLMKPSLAIDVGKDAIWVMDPYTNALVASAWLAQVTATPATRKYAGTSGSGYRSVTLPILVMGVPGVQRLSIGCLDRGVRGPEDSYRAQGQYRFSWRGAVPEDNEPAYWTSGADWLTLVAKFGLAANLAGPR